MKVKINTKVLAAAISDAKAFIPVKSPLAIHKYAKLTTKGLRMKIEANNTQSSITKYMEIVESDQDGSFLLDVAVIAKLIGKIKDETVSLNIQDDSIEIRHKRGEAKIGTVNVKEYVGLGVDSETATEIIVPSNTLRNGIKKSQKFVSQDTLRPQMCAIYMYTEDGILGYCATDTRKLIHGTAVIEAPSEVNFYIMPDVFKPVLNACNHTAGNVHISITQATVTFNFGTVIIRSTQASGKYPNFKKVIPNTYAMECCIEKTDMVDSLNRLGLFIDNIGCVKMQVSTLDMQLECNDYAMAKSCMETINHNGCNGELAIGMNIHNMLVALDAVDGEILLQLTDCSHPIVMKSREDDKLTIVVMPMQLA